MRKFLQISLFVLLLVLTIGSMTLIAAAAETTEGAADAYWKLEQGSTIKYFPTLDEAIDAITADGATVTLQKDAAQTAPSLDVAYTYTIDGNGKTLTSTPYKHNASGGTANNTLFHICNGKPTVKNLTLKPASKPSTIIYIQNANGSDAASVALTNITLENIIFNQAADASTHGIILNQPATLTIQGASTHIEGVSNDAVRVQENALRSVITINDGTFKPSAVIARSLTSGVKFIINGGNFTTGNFLIYFEKAGTAGRRSSVTVNGGSFHFTNATSKILFNMKGNYTDVIFPTGSKAVVWANASTNIFGMTAGNNSSLTLAGGIFVLGTATQFIDGKVPTTMNAATVLFTATDANGEFSVDPNTKFTVNNSTPKIKFGGALYNFYMCTSTNASADIVTEDTTGASIRFGETDATSGIRFTSHLSESIITLAKATLNEGKTVSYGTLIAPADYVAAAGAFTREALDAKFGSVNGIKGGKSIYADVPAVNSLRDNDFDGVYESFSAALLNIKAENISRPFAAVAYVVIDGITYYSSYNTADRARSIRQIAFELIDDQELLGTLTEQEIALLTKYTTNTVANPVLRQAGGDPWVIEHEGQYYYCFSMGNGVAVSRIEGLDKITPEGGSVVYTAPSVTAYSAEYWAPELHYINGSWYIYVAADDGMNATHRMYVLKGTTQNPCDPFEMVGKITDPTDKWAIDGTVLEHKGEMYFIWSGWKGDQNGVQNLYIAHMSDPCTIDSERVLISTPTYDWEKKGYNGAVGWPTVNEGATVLKHGDDIFLVYSASGSWDDDYCMGLLTLIGDDPMNPEHWKKAEEPVFKKQEGVAYGPGHCSFAPAADGSIWMIYHANLVSHSGASGRSIWIAPVEFAQDGTPIFGKPSTTVQLPVPK